ncbi:MAG TPA: hypothetical protein VED66_11705 [Candidatus Sulfotelmatobacter sp.]|nr:hypothetical protein [Candidatus Sulfotelmatobacter sp.]
MLQQVNSTESQGMARTCQAVSPMDDPCTARASYYCDICGRWFCAEHAEDDSWHVCELAPGDEGGEG